MILFKNKSSNKPQEIYKISPSVEVSNVGPTGLTDKLLDGFTAPVIAAIKFKCLI